MTPSGQSTFRQLTLQSEEEPNLVDVAAGILGKAQIDGAGEFHLGFAAVCLDRVFGIDKPVPELSDVDAAIQQHVQVPKEVARSGSWVDHGQDLPGRIARTVQQRRPPERCRRWVSYLLLRQEGIPASNDEPPGAVAFLFDCFAPNGVRRFRAHCYVRDDGRGNLTYGGSGVRLPDPKVLIVRGTKYVLGLARGKRD